MNGDTRTGPIAALGRYALAPGLGCMWPLEHAHATSGRKSCSRHAADVATWERANGGACKLGMQKLQAACGQRGHLGTCKLGWAQIQGLVGKRRPAAGSEKGKRVCKVFVEAAFGRRLSPAPHVIPHRVLITRFRTRNLLLL